MKYQRGGIEIVLVYVILAGVGVLGAWGAIHHYQTTMEENKVLKQDNKTLGTSLRNSEITNAKLQSAQEAERQLDALRQGLNSLQRGRENKANATVQKALSTDPVTRKWYGDRIPSDLDRGLHEQFPPSTADGKALPPTGPNEIHGPNPGPAAAAPRNDDKRPAIRGLPGNANPLAPVQRK